MGTDRNSEGKEGKAESRADPVPFPFRIPGESTLSYTGSPWGSHNMQRWQCGMCRKTEVWTQCPEHLCSYRVSGSSHLTRVKEGCRVESKGPTLGGHCERPSDRWRVWLMLRGSIRPVRFETGSNKQGVPPSPEGAKTAEPKLHHCGCAYTDTQGQRPGGLQTEVRGSW